jgi:histidinol dehydrogenase
MLAIPAQIAGCKEIFYVRHRIKRKINPAILYTANLCGITKFIKLAEFRLLLE